MVEKTQSARDQIIEKTCALLELQGYYATGLNQIIAESGSPKGSLYHYFPGGKDELTAESLERVGKVVLERIRGQLAIVADPAEAIRDFVINVAHNVELSGYTAGGPITTVALETAATNERLRMVCLTIYDGWRDAFRDKLLANGFPTMRADTLSTLIIASLEGGIILARTQCSPSAIEHIAEELFVLLSHK